MSEDAPHDGDERGDRYSKVVKHISGEECGRMSRDALLFATKFRKMRAPQFFLAFLLSDEGMDRIQIDEPQSLHALAGNDSGTSKARNIIEREIHAACGVTRSDIGDAVDDDFA